MRFTRGALALTTLVIFTLLVPAACATEEEHLRVLPAIDPGRMFLDELETRLMRARTVHLVEHAKAEGAVNADLDITLWLGEGQKARLEVDGTFEARPVRTWFVCDGAQMKVRSKDTVPAAPEVRDALVVGLVRMGLLHNAALLVGGAAPDHAAGGVRDFVKAERARIGEEKATDISYDVVVRHDVIGDAMLSLSPDALPQKRTSRLDFEEGAMKVDETFTLAELDGPVDDALFALGPPPTPPPPATE